MQSSIDNLSCSISISVLTLTPFFLLKGATVIAKISVTNEMGESEKSAPGDGTVLPYWTLPDPPTDLTQDQTLTNKNMIAFSWKAINKLK